MSDKAYGLDFFQKITDIHFGGGPWFAVAIVCSVPGAPGGSPIVNLTFPGEAGGTPGRPMCPAPAGLKPAPFQLDFPILDVTNPPVTAADLVHQIMTNAGGGMIGWGILNEQFNVFESTQFFQCGSGILPGNVAFPMQIEIDGGGSGARASVFGSFVSPKGTLKAGPYPTVYLQTTGGGPGVIQEFGQNLGTFTVIVDPVKLTLTAQT